MKNKTLFNSLLFTFSFIGSFFVLDKPLKADSPVCPDPSTTTITSVYGESGSSFYELTGEGFCRGTPDSYGVTVFKMGFCTKNPGNPKIMLFKKAFIRVLRRSKASLIFATACLLLVYFPSPKRHQ